MCYNQSKDKDHERKACRIIRRAFFITKGGTMEVNWNLVIGEAVTQVLRVLVPVLLALVIKWGIEIWRTIKGDRPEWVPIMEYAAEMAVLAAEQIFGKGHGEEKKKYAVETIQRLLDEKGICVDLHVIEDAIEAEVYKWLSKRTETEMNGAEE
jgi:hypothetical protein